MKRIRRRQGFELWSPIPFFPTITTTLNTSVFTEPLCDE